MPAPVADVRYPGAEPAGFGALEPERLAHLTEAMRRHLWPHFTSATDIDAGTLPIFTRGRGVNLYDAHGKRYLDGLAALFTVQIGHGRRELVERSAEQAGELGYFPVWGAGQVPAIELAERLADLAPGDLNRVFFGTGGGDSVESAWKLARQYHQLTGRPRKYKVLSRVGAYHGTTLGALSITGMQGLKQPFEPLVPGAVKVPSTNIYRSRVHRDDPVAFGRWAADAIEDTILAEGADTVAAIFLEPVQNAGGTLLPPPGYFARVREICDAHDVLLVSDETICGFGRLGTMFGCEKFGLQPDIITCAKGMTSGYAVISALIASDRIYDAFARTGAQFVHGNTWGGHPMAAAVALTNLDLMAAERVVEHVAETEQAFGDTLGTLRDLELVGDVRGTGHFWTVELVKDAATREPLTSDEHGRDVAHGIRDAVLDAGLHCRMFSGNAPIIQLCPPLISGQGEFDEITSILRSAIADAAAVL